MISKWSTCGNYAMLRIIAQVYRLSAVHCQVTRYSQLTLGVEEHYFPSLLGDYNRLFRGQIGILVKIWHCNMIYFINGFNLAHKFQICIIALPVKQAECSVHFTSKPGFHGASCQLAFEHTKHNSVLLASVVYGNGDDNRIQFLSPICLLVSLNAEVLVVVVEVGCVQRPWSQVFTFSCHPHRPPPPPPPPPFDIECM